MYGRATQYQPVQNGTRLPGRLFPVRPSASVSLPLGIDLFQGPAPHSLRANQTTPPSPSLHRISGGSHHHHHYRLRQHRFHYHRHHQSRRAVASVIHTYQRLSFFTHTLAYNILYIQIHTHECESIIRYNNYYKFAKFIRTGDVKQNMHDDLCRCTRSFKSTRTFFY